MKYRIPHVVLPLFVTLFIVNGLFLWQNPAQREYLWSRFDDVIGDRRERGFLIKTYLDANGKAHKYAVFVPYQMTESNRLPLVLYLNGTGKNGDDGIAPLLDGLAPAVWEAKRNFPFVVVWPQCPEGKSWAAHGESARRALAILRKTAREYHTDRDRVFLTGISAGGSGVCSIAGENPELFAGIIPISAGSADPAAVRAIAEAGLPVWSFYVDEDQPSLVKANRGMYRSLLRAGASPRFTEIDSVQQAGMNGHNAWDYAYRNPALYRWLWLQNRKNNENRPRFELVEFARPETSSVPTTDNWEIIDETLLRCRLDGHESRISARITEPLTDHLAEFHIEFLPSAGIERCGVGFISTGENSSSSDWMIDVAVDSLSCGGVYSWNHESCLHAASPVAERAVKPGEWNDLRIIMSPGGAIQVELNGWPFLNKLDPIFTTRGRAISLSVAGKSGSEVQWRYLRTRGSHIDSALARIPHPQTKIDISHSPESSANIATIFQAWQARQDAAESLRIQWVQSRKRIERWSRFRAAVAPVQRNPENNISGLIMDGDTAVYETRWWWPRAQVSRRSGLIAETVPSDFFQALEDRFSHRMDRPEELLHFHCRISGSRRMDALFEDQRHGYRGIIFDRSDALSDRLRDMEELFRLAPLLVFRPLSEVGYNIQPQNCRVISNHSWMAGTECLVVEETIPGNGSALVRRYWVDPARRYLILRTATLHENRLREQIDIEYSNKPALGWIPQSWSVVSVPPPASSIASNFFPGNQRLFQFAVAETVDDKINSSLVGAIEVTNFPEQTIFYNQHDSNWYEQLADGQRRPLNADEIVRISTGGELSASSETRIGRQATIGMLVAGLLLLIVWLHFRRRHKETGRAASTTAS